jgi:hypothetical protein
MAAPRHRFTLPPRGMTEADVAGYLGRSPTWFQEHVAALEAAGFPQRLPLIGTRDRKAVDLWLDQQGGLASVLQDFDSAWTDAANG